MTVQNFFSQIGWDTQVRPGNIITQALYTPQHRYILTKCKNYLHSADQRWDEMFVFVIRKIQLSFEITNFLIFARICSFQLQLSNVFFCLLSLFEKTKTIQRANPVFTIGNTKRIHLELKMKHQVFKSWKFSDRKNMESTVQQQEHVKMWSLVGLMLKCGRQQENVKMWRLVGAC